MYVSKSLQLACDSLIPFTFWSATHLAHGAVSHYGSSTSSRPPPFRALCACRLCRYSTSVSRRCSRAAWCFSFRSCAPAAFQSAGPWRRLYVSQTCGSPFSADAAPPGALRQGKYGEHVVERGKRVRGLKHSSRANDCCARGERIALFLVLTMEPPARLFVNVCRTFPIYPC